MTETIDSGEVRSFSRMLEQVDEGQLHHDLTDLLTKIVQELNIARENGSERPKAKLAIALSFCLDGQTIEVRGDYKETLPKSPRSKSIFWTTPNNRLSTNNPKQMGLPLRTVGKEEREARIV